MCISWTIKCLILLMHGATMKFILLLLVLDYVFFKLHNFRNCFYI